MGHPMRWNAGNEPEWVSGQVEHCLVNLTAWAKNGYEFTTEDKEKLLELWEHVHETIQRITQTNTQKPD